MSSRRSLLTEMIMMVLYLFTNIFYQFISSLVTSLNKIMVCSLTNNDEEGLVRVILIFRLILLNGLRSWNTGRSKNLDIKVVHFLYFGVVEE